MEIIKVKIIFGLLLPFFFGVEIKGMLRSQGLSEPARKVRDRYLLLSKQKRAEYIKNIIPNIFKSKKSHILPRFRYEKPKIVKIVSEEEIKEKLEKIKLNDNEFFIYQEDTGEGIKITAELLNFSKTLKNTVGDLGNPIKALLSLPSPFTYKTIQFVFNEIFKNIYDKSIEVKEAIDKISISKPTKHSFQELVDINNLIHFLDPIFPNIQKVYLSAIKDIIDQSPLKLCHNQDFNLLNSDLQKTILLNSTIINFVKGLMMRYNIAHKQEAISKSAWPSFAPLTSVSFSSNNQRIFASFNSSDVRYESAMVIYNVQTKDIMVNWEKKRDVNIIQSKDNTKIVIAMEKNLRVLDAKTLQTLRFYPCPKNIKQVTFSPDSSKILVILEGNTNQFRFIDANTLNPLTAPRYIKHVKDIQFSPDGRYIAISFLENKKFELKVWDVYAEGFIQGSYETSDMIASPCFSSDGTKIISIINSSEINEKEEGIDYKGLKCILISDMTNIDNVQNKEIILKRVLSASSLLLTPHSDILAYSALGEIFFITLDENNIVTNTILIRPRNLKSAIKRMNILAISPNGNRLTGGGIDHSTAKENYLYTWTLLTDEDEKILKNLSLDLLGKENITIDHLKLIYQLWLYSHKGTEPSQYQMDTAEKAIYQSMPQSIKKLLQ